MQFIIKTKKTSFIINIFFKIKYIKNINNIVIFFNINYLFFSCEKKFTKSSHLVLESGLFSDYLI